MTTTTNKPSSSASGWAAAFGIAVLSVAVAYGAREYRAEDYRAFRSILEQCASVGFVQNAKQRVWCEVEVPKGPPLKAADIKVDQFPLKKGEKK